MSSDFAKNVMKLASATAVAQLITFLTSTITSRLFSTEDFGYLSVFTSISTVVAVLATGRYEFAILREEKGRVGSIVYLICILSVVSSLFSLVVAIAVWGYKGEGEGWGVTIFFAVSIFSLGSYQAFYYWLNRLKKYSVLSLSRIYGAVLAAIFPIGAGFMGFGYEGLVFGSVAAQFGVSVLLYFALKSLFVMKRLDWPEISEVAIEFKNYPRFMIVSGVMERCSSQAHLLIIAAMGDVGATGLIGMFERVVSVPQRLLSTSIGDVFKQAASELIVKNGECRELFLKTTRRLLSLAVLPFLVLVVIGPELFSFVFGEAWREAGVIGRLLALKFFFGFVVTPVSSVIFIGQGQRYEFFLQFFLFVFAPVSVVLGQYFFGVKGAVALYALVYAVKYSVEYWIAWGISNGRLSVQ